MGDDITIGVTEIVNNIEVTAQPNDQIVDISVIDNADDVTLNITPTVIEINVNKGSSYAKWGTILGTLSDQTDLQNALDLKANLVGGKVPASELPSYVDDVVEVADYAALPATGETGKIYVTLDNNKIYRWSGSVYIEIAANSAIWGAITGTLSNQTDLQNALNAKFDDPTGDTTQYIAGDGSLITFPIAGQSGTLVREVRNTTGATLLKGTVVYINGATGNKPTIAKAIATGDSTSAQTFGMLQADISNNANGYVVCVGDIIGLDTSAITEGTQLYLSSTTAGAYTSTKQLAPAHLVYIGVVTRSHPTLGQIEVKIQNGYELDEIHDVSITSKTNKDFLVYESATSLWKNKSLGTVLAGTSSQFVKGDGSLDTNSYILSVAASAPLGSTGGTTPVISITQATTSANGYLSSTDWNTFNNKVPTARTLTINGTAYDLSADRSWTINALPSMLEYNDTDKTIWNNGKNNIATNTSFGDGALKTNTSGAYNTAFGVSALNLNTTGSANTAISTYTLSNNTSGYNNTGIGYESLLTNTTGYDNTGVGADALVNNLGGNSNSAVGYGALSSNTSGISNSSIGKYALGANTTGNYNVGVGDNAGNATLGGGTLNTTSSQSTYIGAFASCSANGVTNEIAIGYASSGNGSNSVTLGNTSITKTILRGNVGIGTSSPTSSALLHLLSSSNTYIRLQTTNGTGKQWSIGIDNTYSNGINFSEIGVADGRLFIANGGNVGIGTTSPSSKLHISQSSFNPLRIARDSVSDYSFELGGSGEFYIKNNLNSVYPISILNGGNVGIGTTSPSGLWSGTNKTLQITGGSGVASELVQSRPSATITRFLSGTADTFGVYTADALNYEVYTSNVARMRITSGGNVGIGTTSPNSYGAGYVGLTLDGSTTSFITARANGVNKITLSANGGGGTPVLQANDPTTDFAFQVGTTERMRITSGGLVGIGTTSPSYQLQLSTDSAAKPTSALWTIASDERIKENINSYTKGLNELLKINPITYDYNGLGGFKKGKGGVGIIAQEIAEILPDSVSSIKGKLNETDEEEIDILNFNGHELTYILINAVKELNEKIKILEK